MDTGSDSDFLNANKVDGCIGGGGAFECIVSQSPESLHNSSIDFQILISFH